MQVRCEMCNKEFVMHRFKGMQYSPIVGCAECLKDYLDGFRNPELISQLMSQKNDVEIFENINDGEFRSRIEYDFSEFLIENSIKWEFETYSFMYKNRMYLPDFFLPEYGIFIELKDRIWEAGAYSKFKLFYTKIPLLLITRELLTVWRRYARNKSN